MSTELSPHGRLNADEAMAQAVSLAALGPKTGPNPRVGCVITAPDGKVLAQGWHRGAGTPHAEAAAIADAVRGGVSLAGAVAYVTLEPCSHTGRTGPCTRALLEAGVATVRYAVADPSGLAGGGGEALRAAGVDARLAPLAQAEDLTREWVLAIKRGRPYVIAKWAQTLDGRIAAVDGTSFWITGEAARDHAHQVRAQVDAMIVGTGTVLADDPELSARPGGHQSGHQPLRVVMGTRDTTGSRVWRDENAWAARTHDVSEVLAELARREVRIVLVEGGATVVSAFFKAGVVDEIHAYIAPAILGSGTSVIADLGITTMQDALRPHPIETVPLGPDTLIRALLASDLD